MGPTSRPGLLGRPLLQRLGVREAAVGLAVPDPLLVIGYDENAPSSGISATSPSSVRKVESSSCAPANGARNSHHATTAQRPIRRSRWEYAPRQSHHWGPSESGPKTRTPSPAPRRPASGRGWRATGRAPEAACKSDQQKVVEPITHRPEHDKEVLTEEGLGLMLSRSVSAADAAHRRPDQRTDCRV